MDRPPDSRGAVVLLFTGSALPCLRCALFQFLSKYVSTCWNLVILYLVLSQSSKNFFVDVVVDWELQWGFP